jgi:DNA-binding NtrC family response regulator
VLQQGEYTTVGGRTPIRTDVRIVAATNKDLKHSINQGLFREDLYYRLNVVPLRLPPLRDRAEDIPDLVRHFIQQGEKEGLGTKRFDTEALEVMKAYAWPGNVRELENRVKRAVIMADGKLVGAQDLDLESDAGEDSLPLNLKSAREQADRKVIRHALARSEGNISSTAKMLGISRPTLYDLLKQYDLQT